MRRVSVFDLLLLEVPGKLQETRGCGGGGGGGGASLDQLVWGLGGIYLSIYLCIHTDRSRDTGSSGCILSRLQPFASFHLFFTFILNFVFFKTSQRSPADVDPPTRHHPTPETIIPTSIRRRRGSDGSQRSKVQPFRLIPEGRRSAVR